MFDVVVGHDLGQLVRLAAFDLDQDDFVEVGVGLARIVEAALVPELHVVRARDVRERRAVVRQPADQMMIEAAADAGGLHERSGS